MAIRDLKARIDRAPMQPGVYLFLGADGETLYVGKARVLRDRVRSYLGKTGENPRLDALLQRKEGQVVAAYAQVGEAGLRHRPGLVDVAAVEHQRAAHGVLQRPQVGALVDLPLGHQHQRVGAARGVQRLGHERDVAQLYR